MRNALKQIHCRHDHSWRADAALRATVFDERLLYCVELSLVRRDAFDRFDRRARDLRDRNETTVDDLAVDHDGAGAALAFAAAFFSSGQVKLLAQDIQQSLHRISVKLALFAVNYAIDLDWIRQEFLGNFATHEHITFATDVGLDELMVAS
jgi:hypothetical protein